MSLWCLTDASIAFLSMEEVPANSNKFNEIIIVKTNINVMKSYDADVISEIKMSLWKKNHIIWEEKKAHLKKKSHRSIFIVLINPRNISKRICSKLANRECSTRSKSPAGVCAFCTVWLLCESMFCLFLMLLLLLFFLKQNTLCTEAVDRGR